VTSGDFAGRFRAAAGVPDRLARGTTWLRVRALPDLGTLALPVLAVDGSVNVQVAAFGLHEGKPVPLPRVASFPGGGGARERVFLLARGLRAGAPLYVRLDALHASREGVRLRFTTLPHALARASRHALTISLACGALAALALATALMWLLLDDELFLYYAAMTGLEALYLAYFSGEGFYWPLLSAASALAPYAWNVPVALCGATAYLFAREIAELRRFSPRVYRVFGWLAVAFAALAVANLGRLIGLGAPVAALGNVMFLASGPFVLIVAFLAWRRGSSAAGWFLCAWALLEAFAIVSALWLLSNRATSNDALFYYGLPAAMVAGAVLTALGVADRLRLQRRALTEAERRAQTDPLTGVLNRRSLLERLEAICRTARADSLPVAVLFIDLDFFKAINDTYGHAAGDVCLASLIPPIQAELRHSDIIGRYGGEEFVAVLTGADVAAAQPIAERIRARVAEVRVEGFGEPIQLTCSIGVASSNSLLAGGAALIAQADAAVYVAKRGGRNRVQVAMPLAA
jgi:diguanylate cyclase (GGDEF)-like protein